VVLSAQAMKPTPVGGVWAVRGPSFLEKTGAKRESEANRGEQVRARASRREGRSVKATVYVRLKREVLDPQGDAVKRALGSLGFDGVKGVRIGKLIEIELDSAEKAGPELEQRLAKMADGMLANGVIEDYEIKFG
jgi:phosphoribosylformylglycinamidine synthase